MKVAILAVTLAAFTAGFAAAQNEILTPLNTAVNAMLTAAGVPNRQSARVVPLVQQGATTGFVQIVGSANAVAATRAVVVIQTASPNGVIQAFIPVTTISRTTGALHREYGVAVDAIVSAGH